MSAEPRADDPSGRPVGRGPVSPDPPDDLLEVRGEPTFGLVQHLRVRPVADDRSWPPTGLGPGPETFSSHRSAADLVAVVAGLHPQAIVTEGRVELGGRMVAYSSVGAGAPVVLLADRDDTDRAWQDVIVGLADSHLLISAALPDYGEHPSSTDQEAAGGHAAVLRGLLRTLGQPSVSLVGHGLGALVALRFAEYYPDLVRRLVLIDASVAEEEAGQRVPSGVPVLRLASRTVASQTAETASLLSVPSLSDLARFLAA